VPESVSAFTSTTAADCLLHAETVVNRVHRRTKPLLDQRLTCGLQVIVGLIRMCYQMQSAIVHLQRSMVPSHILPAMRLAASHQHAILRKLCHISPTDLPSAPPGTSSLTSVVAYIL
jgi:hypothetical protein